MTRMMRHYHLGCGENLSSHWYWNLLRRRIGRQLEMTSKTKTATRQLLKKNR